MIFIESDRTDPYWNLALEEYLFNTPGQTEPCLMLWQNDNTIVVGKYQNTAEEINASYVKEHGIHVVRRLSGGGAVYHDRGNLNYTVITAKEDHEDFNFRVFCEPVVAALKSLGVNAEISGRNDMTINGKKFSGSAQYIRRGHILHHSCIMLDSHLSDVSEALRVSEKKYSSRAIKSVRSRVTTINENAPSPIDMDTFKRALAGEILKEYGNARRYTLSADDLSAIEKLKKEKYDTWEWNFGNSPAYEVRKELKFPAGLVTAYMQAEHETIKDIRFYGDFFGDGDIHALEQALTGLRLDANIEKTLSPMNIGKYMHGISSEELAELLLYG